MKTEKIDIVFRELGKEAYPDTSINKKAKKRQAMDNNQTSVQEGIIMNAEEVWHQMFMSSLSEAAPSLHLIEQEEYPIEEEEEEEDDPITNPYSVDFMCWFNLNPDEDEILAQEQHGTHEDYWLSLDVLLPGDDAIWSDNIN